jgi:hypothetical protein
LNSLRYDWGRQESPAARWTLQYPLGLYQTCDRDEKEMDGWPIIDGARINPLPPAGIGSEVWRTKLTPLLFKWTRSANFNGLTAGIKK